VYHCTFDGNSGHAMSGFAFNCIFTGSGPQTATSLNLIEGRDGITRELVFGDNQFDPALGYITPLECFAVTNKLDSSIRIPSFITYEELFSYLATDKIGQPRPLVENGRSVTYGAIEVETCKDINYTIKAANNIM